MTRPENPAAVKTISSRIFMIVFYGNLTLLFMLLAFAWWALEDLEATMFQQDKLLELEYFEENGDKSRPMRLVSAQLINVYQPRGQEHREDLPIVFRDVPVPFHGEVESLGKDYMVMTHAYPEGTFYMAKDLWLFEERERQLTINTLVMALLIIMACAALAWGASRRISRPVLRFARAIRGLQGDHAKRLVPSGYVDAELNEVAAAVNGYLAELEQIMGRERSLIAMASHELRTPVSVVMGAARVIEARGRLGADDAKTLQRILHASQDMADNIRALLGLVRQAREPVRQEPVLLADLLAQLKRDYELESPALAERLLLPSSQGGEPLQTDRTLVKMLIHNLVSNALAHTSGRVWVELSRDYLEVRDEGVVDADGDNAESRRQFENPSTGLGLYIVNMICERLAWSYEIRGGGSGTCIRLRFCITP